MRTWNRHEFSLQARSRPVAGSGEDKVAREAEEAFSAYPHWQTSSHQEQELRRSFYKALISAGVDGVVELAQKLLNMLRRARHE